MKQILNIYRTFADSNFGGMVMMVLAVIFYIAGMAILVTVSDSNELPDIAVNVFFFSIAFFFYGVGIHFRRISGTIMNVLLPDFPKYLILSLIPLYLIFTVLPAFVLSFSGFEFIPKLIMYSNSCIIVLIISVLFGDNILSLISIMWTNVILARLNGIDWGLGKFDFISFDWVADYSHIVQPALVLSFIFLSVFSAYYYFKKISYRPSYFIDQKRDSFTRYYDKTSRFNDKEIDSKISSIANSDNKSKLIQKMQFSLFSPNFILRQGFVVYLLVIIVYFATMGIIFSFNSASSRLEYAPLFTVLYLISSIFTSADFLQHRHNLDMLWIMYPGSRKEFSVDIIKTYLYVAFRTLFIITTVMVIMNQVEGFFTIPELIINIVFASVLFLFLNSFSLLIHDTISSGSAKGWNIFMTIVISIYQSFALIAGIKAELNLFWFILISIIFILTILMLIGAKRKFERMEFNFNEPEIA